MWLLLKHTTNERIMKRMQIALIKAMFVCISLRYLFSYGCVEATFRRWYGKYGDLFTRTVCCSSLQFFLSPPPAFTKNEAFRSFFFWERVKENGRGKRKQTLTIHIFHHLIFYCLMLSYHSRDVMPLMCDNKINFRGKIWKIMVHPLSSWIFRIGSQLAYNTIYCTFIRKTHIDRFILN